MNHQRLLVLNKKWRNLNGVLGGVPFQDASIRISDRDEDIAVCSPSNDSLQFSNEKRKDGRDKNKL